MSNRLKTADDVIYRIEFATTSAASKRLERFQLTGDLPCYLQQELYKRSLRQRFRYQSSSSRYFARAMLLNLLRRSSAAQHQILIGNSCNSLISFLLSIFVPNYFRFFFNFSTFKDFSKGEIYKKIATF